MNHVRIGIIGVGNMGAYHAQQLLAGKIARAELGAVCDVDPSRLAPFPKVRAFADSRELIRSGLVDAVLIATPHFAHTTIGVDALQQGLHVLVEKPISVHKADCLKLLAAHTNKRQVFAAMLNQRTDPAYRKIRGLVGELGTLQRIQWTITDWFRTEAYYAQSGWRATWAGEGGGVLLNQATHNLDLWQWMFGLPARVQARCGFGRRHQIEVEDEATGLFEYSNGAVGVFVTSTGEAPGINRLEVAGEGDCLEYDGHRLRVTKNLVPAGEFSRQSDRSYPKPASTTEEHHFPNHGGQHLAVLENFVAAILDGTPLIAPAAEGTGAVELANAMLWSALRQQVVALPLDAPGYEQELHKLIRHSRVRKQPGPKSQDEVAPYLVKEEL